MTNENFHLHYNTVHILNSLFIFVILYYIFMWYKLLSTDVEKRSLVSVSRVEINEM